MSEHPIQGMMDTAMSNIKSMIDVNTIVGDPVTTPDGTVIIPISTVSFGFGAGGSQFETKDKNGMPIGKDPLFGGGCGGGANIKPVAFMVVGNGTVKLMPATPSSSSVDKISSLIPEIFDKVNGVVASVSEKMGKKKEKNQEPDVTVDVADNE